MVANAPPESFKHRADFLRLAARGRKLARPGFVLQFLQADTPAPPRIGFTATKKIGNAVVRNRARRRLKEAARLTLRTMALPGVEMVLICRRETATLPFTSLCTGLRQALTDAAR